MRDWKDVLPTVVSALGNDVESHACILDFLRVLPEEVTEGRKITLSVRRNTLRLQLTHRVLDRFGRVDFGFNI